MKKIIIYVALFSMSCFVKGNAQNDKNAVSSSDVLFKAMRTEIDRAKAEMKKDSLARPFYISLYVYDKIYRYNFSTLFGSVNNEYEDNYPGRDAYSRLLVGNYSVNQVNGEFYRSYKSFELPLENDEKAIRTSIWETMEEQYKTAAKNYVDKLAWMKQYNFTPQEAAMPNFEKREPVRLIQNTDFRKPNLKPYRALTLELSKWIANKIKTEKLIVDKATVNFASEADIVRFCDTEGSEEKYLNKKGIITILLEGLNKDGGKVSISRSSSNKDLDKLPDISSLYKTANEAVALYTSKFNAQKNKEPYIGPVLVTGKSVSMLSNTILDELKTKPISQNSTGNRFQNMPGVRMVSKQLSLNIKNGASANDIEGVNNIVAPVDDEGVVPDSEMTLIENGIMKNMLTSRTPVVNYPNSNGNFQYDYWSPAKGVTTLTGNVQYNYDELKKMLIEEAKMQGLQYALVLNEDISYKINTKTGEETPFISVFDYSKLNNLRTLRHVLAVENKTLYSTDGKNRYPNSILLEEVELEPSSREAGERKNEVYVPRPNVW